MKTRKLAEVGLVLMGVYYIGASAPGLVALILVVPTRAYVYSVLSAALPLAFAWAVIRYRKGVAARLFPDEESSQEETGRTAPPWEACAYRLVFVLTGVLLLSWALRSASNLLYHLLWYPLHPGLGTQPDWLTPYLRMGGGREVIALALQLLFGLCLLLGAPRLARWFAARADASGAPAPS